MAEGEGECRTARQEGECQGASIKVPSPSPALRDNLHFAISLLLIIGGFLLPPMGIIDGSVLTAVGELLMFGVLAQLPAIIDAAKNGKSIKLTKGDSSIEVSSPQD